MVLGLGMQMYRTLMRTLGTFLFFLLALVIPMICIYAMGDGISKEVYKNSLYGWATLGNLGQDKVFCGFIPFDMGTMMINCPYGKLDTI